MCSHVDFIYSNILCNTHTATDEDMNAIGMLADGEVAIISDVNYEHVNTSMTEKEGNNYSSRMKRSIFACRMDKAVLIRSISSLKSAKNAGQVCSGGHFSLEETVWDSALAATMFGFYILQMPSTYVPCSYTHSITVGFVFQ